MPYLLIEVSNILGGSTYAVTTEALTGLKVLSLVLGGMCAASRA